MNKTTYKSPLNQSINRPNNQPINQSINQCMDRSSMQRNKQLINQSSDRSFVNSIVKFVPQCSISCRCPSPCTFGKSTQTSPEREWHWNCASHRVHCWPENLPRKQRQPLRFVAHRQSFAHPPLPRDLPSFVCYPWHHHSPKKLVWTKNKFTILLKQKNVGHFRPKFSMTLKWIIGVFFEEMVVHETQWQITRWGVNMIPLLRFRPKRSWLNEYAALSESASFFQNDAIPLHICSWAWHRSS